MRGYFREYALNNPLRNVEIFWITVRIYILVIVTTFSPVCQHLISSLVTIHME